MNQALAKKDLDLAAAQKTAEEKMALADQKLDSVGKLEEERKKIDVFKRELPLCMLLLNEGILILNCFQSICVFDIEEMGFYV